MYGIFLLLFFSVFPDTNADAASPPLPLPQTGQTTCYNAMGKVVGCAGTGQDGETLAGVAWPKPRFVDSNDQTMLDRQTGLAWPKDANSASGYMTWQQALDRAKALNDQNYLGHNDWRLPNIHELQSLVHSGENLAAWLQAQGFFGFKVDNYWTSSTYASYSHNAWNVNIYGGITAGLSKVDGGGYFWPVRSGQTGVLPLPATGQSSCSDSNGKEIPCAGSGQDGDMQTGVAWPRPRFTDNGDQTMTDRLTGLVWSKDGKAPGPARCNPGTDKTWQEALDYVTCLNSNRYLGKSDWHLPNRNELASLVNYGHPDSSHWLITQGFINVAAGSYWSSTTYTDATWNAWRIGMHDGAVTTQAHKRTLNVWPVRSGQ